jgi:hypothetical protein
MWSLSFLSSLAAIISAAPPLGHRMMGIVPCVTTTLNSPLTIRSMVVSNCSSVVRALFKIEYASLMESENRSGSETTKLRYWSNICARCSDVPEVAVWVAKSSRRGRGIEERKFT